MEAVARVGRGIYLTPSSPDTTKEEDLPVRWDGNWHMCNATRITSGLVYDQFPESHGFSVFSVRQQNPVDSFTRSQPLVPGMTTFYGRRKTTTEPKEVDWLVDAGAGSGEAAVRLASEQ
jgi:hypothetical protein